jgi:hypothetical protein
MPRSGQRKVAEVIQIDGTVEPLDKTLAKMPLEEAQAIVGGYIEHIRINAERRNRITKYFRASRYVSMWVNEDGVGLGLPFNPKASELAGIPIRGNVIAESWLSRS